MGIFAGDSSARSWYKSIQLSSKRIGATGSRSIGFRKMFFMRWAREVNCPQVTNTSEGVETTARLLEKYPISQVQLWRWGLSTTSVWCTQFWMRWRAWKEGLNRWFFQKYILLLQKIATLLAALQRQVRRILYGCFWRDWWDTSGISLAWWSEMGIPIFFFVWLSHVFNTGIVWMIWRNNLIQVSEALNYSVSHILEYLYQTVRRLIIQWTCEFCVFAQ